MNVLAASIGGDGGASPLAALPLLAALPGRARSSGRKSRGGRIELLMAAHELCVAATEGDCGKLRELLDGGGASVVDERTEVTDEGTGEKFQTTALLEAVTSKQHAAVELLLEHRANPNLADSDGITPLMSAAAHGQLRILRTLLDRKGIAINAVGTENDDTAFHYACGNGHADCAVELARRGCDMTLRTKHGVTGKQLAELMKHTAVLEGLRALVAEQLQAKQQSGDAVNDQQHEDSSPPPAAVTSADELRLAAKKGDCGKLRELLDGGGASVVNQRTEVTGKETGVKFQTTALLQAVVYDQHAAVELLLENGADPSLAVEVMEAGQKFRTTALIAAVAYNRHTAVKLLLEHSANPNLADSRGDIGCTPLMMAAGRGHLPILRTLLDRKGIAIDAVGTEDGYTAFHFACNIDNADCAVELARRGCDMTLQSKAGRTGKQLAEREKHTAVLEGLRALIAEQLRAKPQSGDAVNDQQHEDSSPPPAAMTAVHQLRVAARDGDCDKLRELLDGGGASVVDERTEVTGKETGEKFQTTALLQAVAYDQQAAVELLLERKADPNLANSTDFTPLMEAAVNGHLDILRTLLEHEAAIDAAGGRTAFEGGRTAFEYACEAGNTDCAVELVRQGCNTKLHGVPTKRCKLVQKLAARKAQQQAVDKDASSAQPDQDAEQQKKAAKKTAANRKKKDRKKVKKAAEQQLLVSQPELEQSHVQLHPELKSEPELEVPECPVQRALAVAYNDADKAAIETAPVTGAGLRFDIGDRIHICNIGSWEAGTVIQTRYRKKEWPEGKWAAYQVKLDTGQYIYAPADRDNVCRPPPKDDEAKAELELQAELEPAEDVKLEPELLAEPEPEADTDMQQLQAAAVELRAAAEKGDCGKLRELLDGGGASVVDERTEIMNPETGKKFLSTALVAAVRFGQHAAVELLLECGAKPNLTDSYGYTALMEAATCGHLPSLQTLLKQELIVIDAVEPRDDYTAFHFACLRGHADCAAELVGRGCNTKLRTMSDKTGWDFAQQNGHGALIRRCKGAQKLAVRKAQQQTVDNAASSAPAAAAGGVPQADDDVDQQKKAVKKAAANRKKKDRKRAKKAAELQLISQPEPEPEIPECQAQQAEDEVEAEAEVEADSGAEADLEPKPEPEPELDERTQQLRALTELGMQQWSATQVLEWIALAALPEETVSVVIVAMESLDLDGEELLAVIPKTLQKHLTKHGAQNAEALAKQVIEQRDALLLPGDSASESASPKSDLSDILECPLCMELYCDDEAGLRVPRILTSCGHTVCHGCIANMLTRVLAEGNAKPYKCPTCSKVTKVVKGKAGSLAKNFALAAAAEAL